MVDYFYIAGYFYWNYLESNTLFCCLSILFLSVIKWNNEKSEMEIMVLLFKGQLFITHHFNLSCSWSSYFMFGKLMVGSSEVNLPENQHRSFYIVLWLCVIFGWIMFLHSDNSNIWTFILKYSAQFCYFGELENITNIWLIKIRPLIGKLKRFI